MLTGQELDVLAPGEYGTMQASFGVGARGDGAPRPREVLTSTKAAFYRFIGAAEEWDTAKLPARTLTIDSGGEPRPLAKGELFNLLQPSEYGLGAWVCRKAESGEDAAGPFVRLYTVPTGKLFVTFPLGSAAFVTLRPDADTWKVVTVNGRWYAVE